MIGRSIVAATVGMGGGGVIVGALTLRLNPEIHSRPGDALLLMAYLVVGSAVVGLLGGLVTGLALSMVSRAAGRGVDTAGVGSVECAVLAILVLGPVLYTLMLPDAGLAGGALTKLLFGPGPVGKVLAIVAVGVILGTVGLLVRAAAALARRHVGVSATVLVVFGSLVILGAAVSWALIGAPDRTEAPEVADHQKTLPNTPLFEPTPPVVLLCVDGADLDDVILPMVEAGNLPTLRRFMDEGTWGELETFAPTLSPAVWTTLATGKPKEEHGIHGFTVFHLPGLVSSVLEFPLHSGLNFRLIPLFEKIPGAPIIRLPYTSDMWRSPAVWKIVGRYHAVGVFGWRTTWPAEEVNGFAVASSVTLGETALRRSGGRDPEHSFHPQGLLADLPRPPKRPAFGVVRPYLRPGAPVDPDDPMHRIIRSSVSRREVHQLKHLIERYRPKLTAAAFYSVDAFNHFFGVDRSRGGPFEPALEQRYRFTDQRLGELVESLGPDVNVVVVSDHGYDFINDNHVHAPAGVFFARGPAFSPGRRVRGLTVFDVAPLVLHLVGLPPGRDMPGAASGSYLKALDSGVAAGHRVGTVPSWGSIDHYSLRPTTDGGERDILEELRSLGYIE